MKRFSKGNISCLLVNLDFMKSESALFFGSMKPKRVYYSPMFFPENIFLNYF